MVRHIALVLFLLLATIPVHAARVRVLVDPNGVPEKSQFIVDIEVSTDSSEQVDINSFEMDGKPLDVDQVSEQVGITTRITNGRTIQENRTVTTYRFRRPAEELGVHVIPPISLLVNGKRVASEPTTYEVIRPEVVQDFTLQAAMEGPQLIYPGQEVTFVYVLRAPINMEVRGESVPLLNPEGFTRIGDVQKTQRQTRSLNQWEIRQTVQAAKPGTYELGPSYFEGYLVRRSFFGTPEIMSKRARATAPILTVTIQPFPADGMPLSFTGALGDFQIVSKLISPAVLGVGDRLNLQVAIEGKGNFNSVTLPKLEKQPGFSLFRIGDLPDGAKMIGESKYFSVDLRPMDETVKEIPAIAFSFFDPAAGKYRTVSSQAIPIEVHGLTPPPEAAVVTPTKVDVAPVPVARQGIPIAGSIQLSEADLIAPLGSSRWVYAIPLAGLLVIAVQLGLKRYLLTRRTQRTSVDARKFLARAKSEQGPKALASLEQALLLRLHEREHVPDVPVVTRSLSQTGITGEVRQFLLRLEAERYAGGPSSSVQHLLEEGHQLFDRL